MMHTFRETVLWIRNRPKSSQTAPIKGWKCTASFPKKRQQNVPITGGGNLNQVRNKCYL